MKVINFFGGPGSGKSVSSAFLFSKLKLDGHSCQYINEYAKDCVYQGRLSLIRNDQLYILAKQNHKLKMLQLSKQANFAIVDSPLILSCIYGKWNNSITQNFCNLTLQIFNQYQNINFFIERNKKFQNSGRIHSNVQSQNIDKMIKKFLNEHNIFYQDIQANDSFYQQIINSKQFNSIKEIQ